jgi:hypothetical protein
MFSLPFSPTSNSSTASAGQWPSGGLSTSTAREGVATMKYRTATWNVQWHHGWRAGQREGGAEGGRHLICLVSSSCAYKIPPFEDFFLIIILNNSSGST